MLPERVIAQAACSSANLGSGFDVFGLALAKYHDRVHVHLSKRRKISLRVRGPYATNISTNPARNSAGPPARILLEKAGWSKGLEIIIEKNVPQGLGLGSSGATAAACTKAVDHLFQLNLPREELVRIASLGEKAAAGTAHMDNVAASLLGGFVIVYDNPSKAISFKPPTNLSCIIATPKILTRSGKTRHARKLVPKTVEVRKAVLNIGRASAITAGFVIGDIEMIGSGMQDEIAEPARQDLIPGYSSVRQAALRAGAAGVSISGAGPSIIALVDRKRHDPRKMAKAMKRAFSSKHIPSTVFTTKPAKGARILRGN